MERQNIPWEAISASIKGEADQDQIRLIEEWLVLSPENPAMLSKIMHTWSVSRGKAEFYQPDLSANWMKLLNRIGYRRKKKFIQNIYFQLAAAAAILILVFLSGIELGNRFNDQTSEVAYIKIIAPDGNKSQIVLPDSTRVWLNSGYELQYPSDYSSQNRQVSMTG